MLDDEMQRMNINLEAIEAYRQKDADYSDRVRELEAATAERDAVGGGVVGVGGCMGRARWVDE